MVQSFIADGYVRAIKGLSESPVYLLVLEACIVAMFLWIIFKKTDKKKPPLSYEAEESIIDQYVPEDLIDEVDPNHSRLKLKIVDGEAGKKITVDGKSCLNFATHNYLGLLGKEHIEERAVQSIRKYGVGSCGPRGFYGTVDVHLELEEKLSSFFSQEDAVVYSYGFSTIASAIPAYSKRRDIIFVDSKVNYAIQKGLEASRSEIKWFRHNDMEHLEDLLEEQAKLDTLNPKKARKTRRFLIVEGIYKNTGNLCPLPKLVELKNKHKVRIFIDESVSFGTVGKTGRGVTEYFGIPIDEIDLLMSSMETVLGSVGGFCVGSSFIIEHQRLSGLGYCFSASLPPLLTVAAIESLKEMSESPDLVLKLQDLSMQFHDIMLNSKIMSVFKIPSHPISPLKHLIPVAPESLDTSCIAKICYDNGIAVSESTYLDNDHSQCPQSLVVTIMVEHTTDDFLRFLQVLEKATVN